MLNENSFESSLMVQAAVYIDRLKLACYDYVVQETPARQATFQGMIHTLDELQSFSETAFPESIDSIRQITEDIRHAIEKLANEDASGSGDTCRVCGGTLSTFETWCDGQPKVVPLCNGCSKPLLMQVARLERPTGVWAI